jgi:hypothetical protein
MPDEAKTNIPLDPTPTPPKALLKKTSIDGTGCTSRRAIASDSYLTTEMPLYCAFKEGKGEGNESASTSSS